jgi:hypothetical protein
MVMMTDGLTNHHLGESKNIGGLLVQTDVKVRKDLAEDVITT